MPHSSLAVSLICASLSPANLHISLFQLYTACLLIFTLSYTHAEASREWLYFKYFTSRTLSSDNYFAVIYVFLSKSNTFTYLSMNFNILGTVKLNSSVLRMSTSISSTSSSVYALSVIYTKSRTSGGYISSYLHVINILVTPTSCSLLRCTSFNES